MPSALVKTPFQRDGSPCEPREQRVILGQLDRDAVADEVRARVAGLREDRVAAGDHRADERRAHAALGEIALGLLHDLIVGGEDAVAERVEQATPRVRRAVLRPALDRGAHVAGDPAVAHRRDRHPARDLAGGVAAHAVADREHAAIGVDQVRVLVVLAHVAHVRGGACHEGRGFHSDRYYIDRYSSEPAARIL
jgi:hypothetical protein